MHEIISTNPTNHNGSLFQTLRNYYELTKPRIILLLLITTAAAMWVAAQGHVDPGLLAVTLTGGAMAAAAANTINCIYDRDIDALMARTSHRPIPSAAIQLWEALVFAALLSSGSFILLGVFATWLSASLAMVGIIFYVLVYTHWLKRHTTLNIVIGGAAGAIPPLVGWAAVTGDLSWSAWTLFLIVFLWTPPHFWALALLIADDYGEVGVPMLPVVAGEAVTVRQIWWYTLMVVPVTFLLVYPLHAAGLVYLGFALWLGYTFLVKAWHLRQDSSDREAARSLFKFSLFYLMLLCLGLVIDSLPITQTLMAAVTHYLEAVLT